MIHSEHPFRPEPGDLDPARRFRGRIAAGVTIVTAGTGSKPTGLTVSSLLVIEGDPAYVELVVGPTSDLWDVAAEARRFVVHICRYEDMRLAEVFAGLAPSPGGVFAGVEWEASEWGPVITALGDRAYCTFVSARELGWSGLVAGHIDRVEISKLIDPIVHFRGAYRRLSPGS